MFFAPHAAKATWTSAVHVRKMMKIIRPNSAALFPVETGNSRPI
jgi:hypothetical protein